MCLCLGVCKEGRLRISSKSPRIIVLSTFLSTACRWGQTDLPDKKVWKKGWIIKATTITEEKIGKNDEMKWVRIILSFKLRFYETSVGWRCSLLAQIPVKVRRKASVEIKKASEKNWWPTSRMSFERWKANEGDTTFFDSSLTQESKIYSNLSFSSLQFITTKKKLTLFEPQQRATWRNVGWRHFRKRNCVDLWAASYGQASALQIHVLYKKVY